MDGGGTERTRLEHPHGQPRFIRVRLSLRHRHGRALLWQRQAVDPAVVQSFSVGGRLVCLGPFRRYRQAGQSGRRQYAVVRESGCDAAVLGDPPRS